MLYKVFFFFFKQKTAYEMRISGWSSDVCSSDLVAHAGSPFGDQADRPRIADVLGLEHAGGQPRLVVAGQDRNRRLDDDRPGIHFRHDEMHGAAADPDAGGERLGMRVDPLEGGQQRGMDVDDADRKSTRLNSSH